MTPARFAVAVALAAPYAACSLLAPSDDELFGHPLDAGSPGRDGQGDALLAPVDTGVDVAPADASPTPDAGADAPPVPFCDSLSPGPSFCDDFERATPQGAWTNVRLGATGGALATTTSDSRSPTHSLAVSTPATSPDAEPPIAYLTRQFAQASEVHYAYDLKVVTAPDAGFVPCGQIEITPAKGPITLAQVRLNLLPGDTQVIGHSVYFDDGGTDFPTFPLAKVASYGAWHHVLVDVVLSTAPATATLSLDGLIVLDHQALEPGVGPGAVTIYGGAYYSKGGAWGFLVDNVAVFVK